MKNFHSQLCEFIRFDLPHPKQKKTSPQKSSYFTLKYIKYFPHLLCEPLTHLLPSIALSHIHALVTMIRP